MVEQVKPCPFCGQSGPTKIGYWPDLHGLNHYMQCVCGARHGMNMGEEAAIAAWNTRQTEVAAEARGMAEIERLREALVQHNDRLRSAQQIALRDGAKTNWQAFRGECSYTLAEYHDLVNESRAALNGGQHE